MNRRLTLTIAALVLLLSACAMGPRVLPNPSNPVRSVAVLPFYNATNDLDGPVVVREMVEKEMRRLYYTVKPSKEVDAILRNRMGITLGQQLDLTTAAKLGEELGVDAVLYGYLLNFETVTSGLYNAKKVRAGFRLVDTKTGATIWARGHGVKSEMTSGGSLGRGVGALRNIQDAREGLGPFKSIKGIDEIEGLAEWQTLHSNSGGSVGRAAVFSLGEKLVTKALKVHLRQEASLVVKISFKELPPGPGSGPAPLR